MRALRQRSRFHLGPLAESYASGENMIRMRLLAVLASMLTSALGTIVMLVRIVPLNADSRMPLALTVASMVIAGLLAIGALALVARRSA